MSEDVFDITVHLTVPAFSSYSSSRNEPAQSCGNIVLEPYKLSIV
jgi:hypothetical protein